MTRNSRASIKDADILNILLLFLRSLIASLPSIIPLVRTYYPEKQLSSFLVVYSGKCPLLTTFGGTSKSSSRNFVLEILL
jgi:hypothetical protein